MGEGGEINPFSKMGDKGEGGVKNLKKWVTSFMDAPFEISIFIYLKCFFIH